MTQTAISMRLPAEWESYGGVLLSWPHAQTDWVYMLDEVTDCFIKIAEVIVQEAVVVIVAPDIEIPKRQLCHLNQSHIIYVKIDTDDTWARDFGAITTIKEDGIFVVNDFKFNGWGLKFKSCNDNMITRKMVKAGILTGEYANRLGFVLEGGSIESDGRGLLLTTTACLLSVNRNGEMSRKDIESYLSQLFGLKKILWLEHGALVGDDTDSHIDMLARLAPNDIILYTCTDDKDDVHYTELQLMKQQLATFSTLDGKPFNLMALPLPDPIYDEAGNRLPATYTNFLIMPHSVLMPIYGQPQKDKLASQILKKTFPNHNIKEIDCRALIKQHGSLHCVTMQLPKAILPI